MTYRQFVTEVTRLGIRDAELRCDVPPTPDVLDLLGRCPKYEQYALRYLAAAKGS